MHYFTFLRKPKDTKHTPQVGLSFLNAGIHSFHSRKESSPDRVRIRGIKARTLIPVSGCGPTATDAVQWMVALLDLWECVGMQCSMLSSWVLAQSSCTAHPLSVGIHPKHDEIPSSPFLKMRCAKTLDLVEALRNYESHQKRLQAFRAP